jgi:hypothetical protein
VSASDVIEVVEQQFSVIPQLTDNQAASLKLLGQELRGSDSYWGSADDEDSGNEDLETTSSVIQVSRRPEDKGWRIMVDRAVGVIGIDDLQINILPKIGSAQFSHIAALAIHPPATRLGREIWQLDAGMHFISAVWGSLLAALEVTLQAGLHCDYQEKFEESPFLRGRLDIRGTAVNLARGRLSFPSTFEELSPDNPINRIFRAAAEYVERSSAILISGKSKEVDRRYRDLSLRARDCVHGLSVAGDLRSDDIDVDISRLAAHQVAAFNLSCQVLQGVGRSLKLGNSKVSCFLQPTDGLIEDGIRSLLHERLGIGVSVTKKGRTAARLRFNPDLVVEVDHGSKLGPIATGDVKYRIRKNDWPREILLQAMGFAQVFTADQAFFIDFSIGDKKYQTQTEVIHEVTYHHVTWPTGGGILPSASEDFVIKELQEALFLSAVV